MQLHWEYVRMKYAEKRTRGRFKLSDIQRIILSDIVQGIFLVIEWQGTLITVDIVALVLDIVILIETKG